MPTVVLAPPQFLQYLAPNNSGSPAVGYKLFTYAAGTSTKQATYTDSSAISQNLNPIVLDGNGVASIWGDPTLGFKFVWAPANDTDPPTSPIRTLDNFFFPATLPSINPTTGAESSASVTPANFRYTPDHIGADVRRYGNIDLTGATDCKAILATAASVGNALYLPPGTYRISSNLTLTAALIFDQGAILKPDVGVVVTITGPIVAGPWQIFNTTNTPATGASSLQQGVTPIAGPCPVDRIYAEWFGAVGNGAANDGPALQSALNFGISNYGGWLQLLQKVYVTQQQLYACGSAAAAGKVAASVRGIPAMIGGTPTRGTLLTDGGAFNVVGTPLLTYRCSPSSLDQHVITEHVVFDSTTPTFTIGLQWAGISLARARHCVFGPTGLLEGIQWNDLDSGVFCERDVAETCEFWPGCATPAHFKHGSGTGSFRGSGLDARCAMAIPTSSAMIVIDNGARPYNAVLDADCSGSSGTLIQNNNASNIRFSGRLSLEISGTVTLGSANPVFFAGTIDSNGAGLVPGTFVRCRAIANNPGNSNAPLDMSQGYQQAGISTGTTTLTSAQVLGAAARIVYLLLTNGAGTYRKTFLLCVNPTGAAAVVTGLTGAAPAPMWSVDTPAYGNPTFGSSGNNVTIANALWVVGDPITATWYEVQTFPGTVTGLQVFF